jgi:hypothetical protein
MGWVRSYLDAVRRLRAKLQGSAFTLVGGEDGKRQKVTEADFLENFLRNSERLRVRYRGEEVLPPHPVGEALKETVNPLPQLLQNAADAQRRLDAQLEDESK